MKKKKKADHEHEHGHGRCEGAEEHHHIGMQQELEILKAVVQAWQGHSGSSSRATSEFDALRLNFRPQPSRFRLEAMNHGSSKRLQPSKMGNKFGRDPGSGTWDFAQSLWDSYEILAVSKKLESGMVLDDPFSEDSVTRALRRRRESKNSLRNLFNLVSSRRFNESNLHPEQD